MPSENDDPMNPDASMPHDEADPKGPGFVPDFVRRMAWAGLGAVFMSEEGIRKVAGQLKLPKEALGFLIQQAEKTKDDVGRVVSEEVRKFLHSDRLRDELLKLLAGMTIEVKAEVKLVPDRVKGEAVQLNPKITIQDLKAKAQPERERKKKSAEPPSRDDD